MNNTYPANDGRPLPLQPNPQKYGFVCYFCGRQRPWTDLEFSKDGNGRFRRVCRMCEMSYHGMRNASEGLVN